MSTALACPICGSRISADAPEGLCPACLFQAGAGMMADPERAGGSISAVPRLEQGSSRAVTPSAGTPGMMPAGPHDRVRYFGDYEFREELDEIARGGMGVVYRARQVSLDRTVALKMILPNRLDKEAVRRFRQEVESAANLDHPNIVPVFEFGQHEGQHFYSMKLIEGRNLADELPRFHEDPRASARLMATIARAVHYAHQRGVLHRDLKPQNILVDRAGQPHVADFGLAKRMESGRALTLTGDWAGTPDYMAPEQAAGEFKNLTTAADIYSLGAIFYALLTGRPPHHGPKPKAPWLALQDEPARPRSLDPRIDADLETICLKCLDTDPNRRYPSAAALADDLDCWLRGEPITARPVPSWERALKWARRKPAIAALSAAVVLVAFAGMLGIAWQWRAAVANAENARLANNHLAKAVKLERFKTYVAHINQAQREWDSGRISRARELLDNTDGVESRGFEWNLLKRRFHQELLTLEERGERVRFSPDEKRIGFSNGTVQLCDPDTGRKTLEFVGFGPNLAFSPDGKRIVSKTWLRQDEDGRKACAIIRDTETGEELTVLYWCVWADDHSSIVFSPDGRCVATVVEDGTIVVWDAKTGEPLRCIPTQFDDGAKHLVFSPDSSHIASNIFTGDWRDTSVKMWAIDSGQLALTLDGHDGLVHDLTFSPNGEQIATLSFDALLIWDTATGRQVSRYPVPPRYGVITLNKPSGLMFSPDGRRIAYGAGKAVLVKDLASKASGDTLLRLEGHEAFVTDVAFSPNGRRIASAAEDGKVKIWDATRRPNPSRRVSGRDGTTRLTFSPCGRYLAKSEVDTYARDVRGSAGVYDLSSNQGWRYFELGNYPANDLAFSPDGQLVAVAGRLDNAIKVCDFATGRLVRTLNGHTSCVNSVAFSPDGRYIASAGGDTVSCPWNRTTGFTIQSVSFDHSVRVWDARTGQAAMVLKGQISLAESTPIKDPNNFTYDQIKKYYTNTSIEAVVFSPDGMHIASGSRDGTVRVWDLRTRKASLVLEGHTDWVTRVAFSPNGKRIASASRDGTVRIWDSESNRRPVVLKGYRGAVNDVAFSPDGIRIATGGDDGSLVLWEPSTGQEVLTLGTVGRYAEVFGEAVKAVAFSPDGHQLAACNSSGEIELWDCTDRP